MSSTNGVYLADLGFEHDVFISYCHDDDVPLHPGAEGWVSQFKSLLENRIRVHLGCRHMLSVWRDRERVEGYDRFNASIPSACSGSAVLVCIVSPSYLNSDWCKKEREAFLARLPERSGKNTLHQIPVI